MAVSLNAIWDQFVGAGEASYANKERDPMELMTSIAFRFEDGREATGMLCVMFFDNHHDDKGHIGVQVQMDTLDDEEKLDPKVAEVTAGYDLITIDPYWGDTEAGAWTKEVLAAVFNIDPDSPIWDTDEN